MDGIPPAAGLRALPLVAASARQNRGKQAAPGISDAHGTVNKSFQLQAIRRILRDLGGLCQRYFPGKDDAFDALPMPESGALGIERAGLRAQMHFQPGLQAALHDARIGYNDGIDAHLFDLQKSAFSVR